MKASSGGLFIIFFLQLLVFVFFIDPVIISAKITFCVMAKGVSFSVIFLCGGVGSRAQLSTPKQYHKLCGLKLFQHSLEPLLRLEPLELCVVCEKGYQELFQPIAPNCLFAQPGLRRQDSTEHGLKALSKPVDYVLIHDSARPCVSDKALHRLLSHLGKQNAATLACKATSTLRISDALDYGIKVLPRESIWEIQTPQLVRKDLLEQGLKIAKERQILLTDDVAAIELLGYPVKLVENDRTNIKITYPEDLLYAEFLLGKKNK